MKRTLDTLAVIPQTQLNCVSLFGAAASSEKEDDIVTLNGLIHQVSDWPSAALATAALEKLLAYLSQPAGLQCAKTLLGDLSVVIHRLPLPRQAELDGALRRLDDALRTESS
jgi:hypothetical protein